MKGYVYLLKVTIYSRKCVQKWRNMEKYKCKQTAMFTSETVLFTSETTMFTSETV